jgi:leader peptidase (prepilin peptidase)/N-methyltransferase
MRPVLCGLLFVSALTAASVSDIRSRTIPYSACILLAAAGLISFSPAHLFGLILAVPFFLASGFGRGGAGDTMLVAAASLTLGFWSGLAGLVLALLLFLLFAAADRLLRHIRKRKDAPQSYPLAPFLSIGFLAAYIIL